MTIEEYYKKLQELAEKHSSSLPTRDTTEIAQEYAKRNEQAIKNSKNNSTWSKVWNNTLGNYLDNAGIKNRFADGYQFGDSIMSNLDSMKAVGTTAFHGFNSLVRGVETVGNGLANLVSYGIAEAGKKAGNQELYDRIHNNIRNEKTVAQELQEKLEPNSFLTQRGGSVLESTGQSGTYMALNMVPGVGTALSQGAIFGSATGNALQNEFTEKEKNGVNKTDGQIWTHAIGSGAIEGLSENLFGLMGGFGKGTPIDEKITNTLAKGMKSGLGKIAVRLAGTMGGEASEEFIAEFLEKKVLNPVMNMASKENAYKYANNIDWKQVGQEMLDAGLSAGISGGASQIAGIQAIKENNNLTTKEAINEYAKMLDEDAENTSYINKTLKNLDRNIKDIENSYNEELKSIEEERKNNKDTDIQNKVDTERVQKSENYKTSLQGIINNLPVANEVKERVQGLINSDALLTEDSYTKVKENLESIARENGEELQRETYNQVQDQINQLKGIQDNLYEQRSQENYTDRESRKFYAQQMNQSFSDDILNMILDAHPVNRNGRRTVGQYKDIARQYGEQMAVNGLNFEQVRQNTVRAWQELLPSKNITRYDNQEHAHKGFERLNTDTWSKEVYSSYKQAMSKQINDRVSQLEKARDKELDSIAENTDTVIDTINNLDINLEQYREEARNRGLIDSAEEYGINTSDVSEIQELASRRGIVSYYDASKFNDSQTGSYWTYEDGVPKIVFNPKATNEQIIHELAVHEFLHDLRARNEKASQRLYDLALKQIDKNSKPYQNLYNTYAEDYSNSERNKLLKENSNLSQEEFDVEVKKRVDKAIEEEAVAKLLQMKLGNQEFVTRLVESEPSIARNIYNAVVDFIDTLTGHKIEKLYWTNVKNRFEQAFNSTPEGYSRKTTKNSIKTDKNGIDYVEIDVDQKQFDGLPLEGQRKLARKILQEKYNNTINENINLPSKSILKYTDATANLPAVKKRTKYRLSTELDNLYKVAKKINDSLVEDNKNHNLAKDGWNYYFAKFKFGDKEFIGKINEGITDGKPSFYDITDIYTPEQYKGRVEQGLLNKKETLLVQLFLNDSISKNDNYVNQEQENLPVEDLATLPKIKEGYTRLYRGLENEYNSNFDKSKLDNVNGYESWTDNYNLAKEYGNNVYYTDIPTNEIKNSVLDENANSETYGDRNLIYKNDKPIALNNKNGNEYMLYTDHDNYKDIQYNKVTKTTNKDSDGKQLSKQQQEYFKDSEIRDNDGNLQIMYHGTPDGEFNIFNEDLIGSTNDTGWYGKGFYFTKHKGEAGYYGSDIKEVYLNITNPFNYDKEMQTYDGQRNGDVYFDFGSFMINLNNKFNDIAKNNTIDYGEYTDTPGELEVKQITLSELANKIEELYKDDNFKIVEVEDRGKTKYEYRYENPTYSPYMYSSYNTLEEAQKQRLSEVVGYIKENIYHSLDMHIPETFMQSFSDEITDKIKQEGYDGIIQATDGDEVVAFYPEQIKYVDNVKPTENVDMRYSKSTLNQKDNQGRNLSNGQVEYFKDSKARDDKGNLINVFHTTTDKIAQFNEFNPVGTPYYRFGKDVVNFYTDNKEMSSSYADNYFKEADSRKITNMKEFNNYLDELNDNIKDFYKIDITKNNDGSYTASIRNTTDENTIYGTINKYLQELQKEDLNKYNVIKEYAQNTNETDLDKLSIVDEFARKVLDDDNIPGTYSINSVNNKVRDFLREYSSDVKFNNKEDLFKNFKYKIAKDTTKNLGLLNHYQYSGYVNIENPYIVDAEERNWNQVVTQSNELVDKLVDDVPQEIKDRLTNLYLESEHLSTDMRSDFYKYDDYISAIKGDNVAHSVNVDDDIRSMNRILYRVGFEDIEAIDNGYNNDLSSNLYYALSDVLEQEGIIDSKKAEYMRDNFVIPEEARKYIKEKLHKEFKTSLPGISTLYDLYKKRQEAYETFDKYRYPQDYFIERIKADSSSDDYVELGELNDILIDEVERIGEDAMAEKLAEASSTGFSKTQLIKLWGLSKTTNDVVGEILDSNKAGKTNYDGVIIKNVYDYGGSSTEKTPGDLYITFNSNQFKSTDNLNPTNNKDWRYSKNTNNDEDLDFDTYMRKKYGEGTKKSLGEAKQILPTQQKQTQPIMKTIETPKKAILPTKEGTTESQEIAKILNKPVKDTRPEQRAWALFKANILDKGSVFERLSFKAKNRELQAKWDSTLLATAKGQNAIGQDRYTFENGKETKISKSLTSIMDEVGNNTEEFSNYMYHLLNIDRMTLDERYGTKNKPVFGDNIDANYSRQKVQEIENRHPEFKDYAQDVYDYLNANKQELVDNGVISQETSDYFAQMYPHYVPIKRVNAKGLALNVPLDTKRTGINSPIKKAKGGNQDIQPLFQTIADRTMQTYRASSRNAFGLELKNTLDSLGMFNQTEQTTEDTTDNENIFNYDEEKESLTEGTKYQNPTFTVFNNGEKVTYEIDQDMYDALKPKNELFSKWDNTKLMKTARAINDIRRGVLTEYNPVFSLTNAIKDAQDVLLNSQHATRTYTKFLEAYAQILKKGYWYKEYIQNGGSQNSYFTDGDFVKQDSKAKSVLTLPLRAISNVNNVIEMAPRLSEYIASREQGKSIQGAMLDASRVTTNFKAGGDVTKFLNRNGATFLNASVQGLNQNIRNIREANAKGLKGYSVLLGKSILAGLPALLLNNLIWKDDDDYEELQDYAKNNYYIIAKIGDHKFLRIPKGRTVAVIQKAMTNMADFMQNKDEINADKYAETIWKDLKDTISLASDNLAPNNPIENNIISPLVQAKKNKTWYDTDLIPSRLQNKPVNEQYDETTDELSKGISSLLNKINVKVSPIKINYLLDQYSGGVGDVLLPMGTPQAENNVLEDKFTTDSVMKSKYPGEFYDKLDELTVNRNSEDATNTDELLYKYANSVSSTLSDLYKQKREIQGSDKTDTEKKQEIEEVQEQINTVSKDALNSIANPYITEDTAIIGDLEWNRTQNKSGEYEWKKKKK